MRVGVYLDQGFWRDDTGVYAARSFVLFLGRLAERFDRLVVTARLDPDPGSSHYRLPEPAEFLPLPHYASAADPVALARALAGSMRRFWRLLGEVDVVWLLGPQPFSVLFALMALARRKRVVLGVRQDFPRYVRNRHPGRRGLALVARLLDGAFRFLARCTSAVVVGPDLARIYRRAGRLLEIYVSLVDTRDVVPVAKALERSYDGEVRLLSVSRLDPEKNPLLLAEILAGLPERYRLAICGDGPLESELEAALRARGLDSRVELLGHVPMGEPLIAEYRRAAALLHVSWTEGVPQVLLEAFAAGLPVVATDVGGVAEATRGAALLIPPGDAEAARSAIERIAGEPDLRRGLVERGHERISAHTLDAEADRVAGFLRGA